jgi:2,4-dienoyl-CoA reductase-like NADH-dependent reductase (Old Yellow Enzyme family)
MSLLFSPMQIRSVDFRNRIWVAPMCQYSAVDGHPTDWHLVHLGSLARGGAGLVVLEATAVTAAGRITPGDLGIWSDEHIAPLQKLAAFISEQGSVPGIQLGHSGRKGSANRPWDGDNYIDPADGGWATVGPTDEPHIGFGAPVALDAAGIADVVEAFAAAARRAVTAGFKVIEIHAGHGYLLHQFLSPLANTRTDEYGGDLDGRTKLLAEVVAAVRAVMPDDLALFVRFSATDWVDGGWTIEETVAASALVADLGVDLIDCSSGAMSPKQVIPVGPGYQVPFARAVREQVKVLTSAVGFITEPEQAEEILVEGSADAIFMGKGLLRHPHWPLMAAKELGDDVEWPAQYRWANRPPVLASSS